MSASLEIEVGSHMGDGVTIGISKVTDLGNPATETPVITIETVTETVVMFTALEVIDLIEGLTVAFNRVVDEGHLPRVLTAAEEQAARQWLAENGRGVPA